jgi:uncharacterized protein (DUF2336 family)
MNIDAISSIKRLGKEATVEVRTDVADKIGHSFASGQFNSNEKRIAVEIFRLLVNDVEKSVRKILSTRLAHSMEAPHDVIIKMAQDEKEVALPVLKNSFVLSESDLIDITSQSQDIDILCTIAKRDMVSRELSNALIDKHNITITGALIENKNASIDEKGLHDIYNNFSGSISTLENLAKRGGMPVVLAEKLFVAVSDEVKRILNKQYSISYQESDSAASYAREMATLGLTDDKTSKMEMIELVHHLNKNSRLTLSIIIRALCLGNLRFFEAAFAELTDIPINNARILIADNGIGFEALYKKSRLPNEMFAAISYLLNAALIETNLGRYHKSDFKQSIIERIIKDKNASNIEYIDYIMRIMQNNIATT